jgi:hypothetical protein
MKETRMVAILIDSKNTHNSRSMHLRGGNFRRFLRSFGSRRHFLDSSQQDCEAGASAGGVWHFRDWQFCEVDMNFS